MRTSGQACRFPEIGHPLIATDNGSYAPHSVVRREREESTSGRWRHLQAGLVAPRPPICR